MREQHNDAGLADAAEGPGNDGGGQIFGYARGHKRAETVCDKVHTHEPRAQREELPHRGNVAAQGESDGEAGDGLHEACGVERSVGHERRLVASRPHCRQEQREPHHGHTRGQQGVAVKTGARRRPRCGRLLSCLGHRRYVRHALHASILPYFSPETERQSQPRGGRAAGLLERRRALY